MLNCPKCGSDNTQKLSIVFQQGTSALNFKTGGIGLGSGLAIGAAKSKGSTQSALAKKYGPPKKMKIIIPSALIFLAVTFISSMIFSALSAAAASLLPIVATLAYVIFAMFFNIKKWPGLFKKWETKFLCMRCETEFVI